MICPKCGKQIADGSYDCIYCDWTWKSMEDSTSKIKFCGQCGTQLNSDAAFCFNCGSKTMTTNNDKIFKKPDVSSLYIVNDKNKQHCIFAVLGQILCAILFFTAKIEVGAYGMTFKELGFFDICEPDGAAWPLMICSLILLFVAIFNMIYPLIKNMPIRSKTLTFMQVMSIVFFSFNILIYVIIAQELEDDLRGSGDYGLNTFGLFYAILSIVAIIHLFYLKSEIKKFNSNRIK